MQVNNIMLEVTPQAVTEENELPPIVSPGRQNPKTSAVYESISVDIKRGSMNDNYSLQEPSSEVLETKVHPI